MSESTKEQELIDLTLRLNRGLEIAEKRNVELVQEINRLAKHNLSIQGQLNAARKNLEEIASHANTEKLSIPEGEQFYRTYCSAGQYPIVPYVPPHIPDAHLFAWFRGVILEPQIKHWDLERSQDVRYLQPLLYFLARTHHAKTIVEIGVAEGSTSWPLVKAASEMEGGMVHSVDPSEASKEGATDMIRRNSMEQWWSFHHMQSDDFWNGEGKDLIADFVYIDGDHSYASIKSDLENALNHTREGSIIVMHDLHLECDDLSFLDQYPKDHSDLAAGYGVIRACRDVLPHYNVDYFPLIFGAMGLERHSEWTEGGALLIRRRMPTEAELKHVNI